MKNIGTKYKLKFNKATGSVKANPQKTVRVKKVKAWAVLERGHIVKEWNKEGNFWIAPTKPKREDYHSSFSFIPVTISYQLKPKKK